jgi:hypothetical protein
MHKIASPQELQAQLQQLLELANSPNPSREKLAKDLRALADRVAMRGNGEVIESRRWRHKDTGATASLYGAVPWTGQPGDTKSDWVLENVGWTIRWDDGTIGTGHVPDKSREEAEERLLKIMDLRRR